MAWYLSRWMDDGIRMCLVPSLKVLWLFKLFGEPYFAPL